MNLSEIKNHITYMSLQYGQRPGQWFANMYVSEPMPELYYCENATKAAYIIYEWMHRYCYTSFAEIPQAKTRAQYE